MFEQEYRRRFDGIRPDPALVAETKGRMAAAGAGVDRRPRRVTRRAAVALAVCAALVITAAAAGPAIWQAIRDDLGDRAPYATEVQAACEDQGVRMEVHAALADTRVTRVYFTLQDLTGALFGADTTSDLTLSLETGGAFRWGNGGRGLEILDYDPEQHLATLVYSRGTDELSQEPPTRARLDITWFLPGVCTPSLVLDGDAIPAGTLESAVLDTGETVLLPGQNPMALEGAEGEVSVSSLGFAADGCFHIRLAQGEDVSPAYGPECAGQPIFSVRYYLHDPEDPDRFPAQDVGDAVWTEVEGGWDVRLPGLTAGTLPCLDYLVLRADYSVAGGRVEGDWSATVPVEPVESRAAVPGEELIWPYTNNGETPYGHSSDARLERVAVSPLSVCADFSTPEGQDKPCQLNGTELEISVTLSGGAVLTPDCTGEVWSQRAGWVMWEFDQPIDPEDVASVTLNGHTISLDNS